MPTYQTNIPTGTVDLNVDYLALQGNFQTLNTTYGIDHVPFANSTPAVNGFHGDIHFNPVSTTATQPPPNYNSGLQYPASAGLPAVVAGIGQLFSSSVDDSVNTDTGLYWLSGNGNKVALTRNFAPTVLNNSNLNGFTFLPGGIILQWGAQSLTGGQQSQTGTLNFATNNMNFPNVCFNLQLTLSSVNGGLATAFNTISFRNASLIKTSFVWDYKGDGQMSGFYWVAMGV